MVTEHFKERLIFGKDPGTYEQAKIRLPSIFDPILQTDRELLVLSEFRTRTEQTDLDYKKGRNLLPLNPRLTLFTSKTLPLLENLSSRRGPNLIFETEWGFIRIGNIWEKAFPLNVKDYNYYHWTVRTMIPSYEGKRGLILICVEADPNYPGSTPVIKQDSIFRIGLVTQSELNILQNELLRYKQPQS